MKTDAQVQQDVIAELKWEPSINAAQISVAVKDGVVTLAGHVSSYAQKCDAERVVQRVLGVKGLVIEVEVVLAGFARRKDADIASAAQTVLRWTSCLAENSIQVSVENGWVTLTGEVPWEYQRESAAGAVGHLMGVIGVSDQIAIKPRVSLSAVRSDIEAALMRRAMSEPQKISVDVRGSNVILEGAVHSWSERDLARTSAWATPGVRQVVDKLTIAN